MPNSAASLFLPRIFVVHGEPYNSDKWCPMSVDITFGWSRALLLLTLGHFSCCLGDSLASELGILSKSSPVMITTFRRVPPGTNGAISIIGTVASVAGGFLMGLTLAICLAIENSTCRQNWSTHLLPLLILGSLAGGLGSLIDSFMGATIQETRQSSKTNRILPDEHKIAYDDRVKVISGFDILTNNQVNLMSSIVTAWIIARFA